MADPFHMQQLEDYLPLVERALSAVQNASKKIKTMNDEIQSRGTAIEHLQERLATVSEEAERSRERADKLEARFEQVPTDGFIAPFKPGVPSFFISTVHSSSQMRHHGGVSNAQSRRCVRLLLIPGESIRFFSA